MRVRSPVLVRTPICITLTNGWPASLGFADAAALLLISLTAWQLLFDRSQLPTTMEFDKGSLLDIGGAGGVGSILIQLARRLTGLTEIATASWPDSIEWCLRMGASCDRPW
jgi:NADPH:quinone reductase-like Zn-dependent oxidoreductase